MFLKYFTLSVAVILAAKVNALTKNPSQLRSKRYSNSEPCGTPTQSTSLVINGNDFQRGNWPWMVAMMEKTTSPPRFFCGSVLVAENKILTGKYQTVRQNNFFSFEAFS